MLHKLGLEGLCEQCGEGVASPNIEAWELTGDMLCDECAESAFADIAEDDL
jgi:formylmethanofuran dehydrogenase subunit E